MSTGIHTSILSLTKRSTHASLTFIALIDSLILVLTLSTKVLVSGKLVWQVKRPGISNIGKHVIVNKWSNPSIGEIKETMSETVHLRIAMTLAQPPHMFVYKVTGWSLMWLSCLSLKSGMTMLCCLIVLIVLVGNHPSSAPFVILRNTIVFHQNNEYRLQWSCAKQDSIVWLFLKTNNITISRDLSGLLLPGHQITCKWSNNIPTHTMLFCLEWNCKLNSIQGWYFFSSLLATSAFESQAKCIDREPLAVCMGGARWCYMVVVQEWWWMVDWW